MPSEEVELVIPTRSLNSHLKQFCLEDICSGSSDGFDYPYYHSYTMDAYQNLISGDKGYRKYELIVPIVIKLANIYMPMFPKTQFI